ncbi:MAG: site-specific integrase [Dehalococcoidia bacterium]|nr:site-specific integrase [Dehalococcoidia bacterium]
MSKRRSNGEGSIYKRADGRWAAGAMVNGERRTFYGKTHEEVSDKLLKARQANRDGKPLPKERLKAAAYLENWLKGIKPNVRPSTHSSYSDLVRLHLIPEIGKVSLAKLTPAQVQALITKKLASGLSPRTVQYIRAVLRRALSQALKWDLVSRNVATLVDPPRVPRNEIMPLGPQQARKLLEAATQERLGALYTLGLATGMRQCELLGLRWTEDVDLEQGIIHVNTALQRINGEYRLVEPKTTKSRRTLHLPGIAITVLRAQRAKQLEERLHLGPNWQNTMGLVFTTEFGSPLNRSAVTHGFQKFLARSGLPKVAFHSLRHSAATLLLVQGVPARAIMEVLGHSQISVTMNTYAHILPAMQQEAAAKMDAILSG